MSNAFQRTGDAFAAERGPPGTGLLEKALAEIDPSGRPDRGLSRLLTVCDVQAFVAGASSPDFRILANFRRPTRSAGLLEPFVARLKSVMCQVSGRAILPAADGPILHDEYALHPSLNDLPKGPHARLEGGRFVVADPICRGFIQQGIHLCHEYDKSYFHWIVEVLPRLRLLEGLGLESIPLLIADDVHPNLIELLRMTVDDRWRWISLPAYGWVFVEDLIYPSDISLIPDAYDHAPAPEETIAATEHLVWLRERIMGRSKRVGAHPRKAVYLRRGSSLRGVLNQDELVEGLFARGVEIASMNIGTIEEQIDLFSSSDLIISPTGAAMTNVLWCRPGTVVICLVSDHPAINFDLWRQLASISGARIVYVIGPRADKVQGVYAIHDDFTIPAEKLFPIVDDILAGELP